MYTTTGGVWPEFGREKPAPCFTCGEHARTGSTILTGDPGQANRTEWECKCGRLRTRQEQGGRLRVWRRKA